VLCDENGDPPRAERRGDTVVRLAAAASAERRPKSETVAGLPSCLTDSGLIDESRDITGVTSVGYLASTPRKTRSISRPGFACAGDLVVNGPVMMTPV
jgi:hypothetical protein